jgi:hypothetical protein
VGGELTKAQGGDYALRPFRIILEYESNRPSEQWYGNLEKLDLTGDQRKIILNSRKTFWARQELTSYIYEAS